MAMFWIMLFGVLCHDAIFDTIGQLEFRRLVSQKRKQRWIPLSVKNTGAIRNPNRGHRMSGLKFGRNFEAIFFEDKRGGPGVASLTYYISNKKMRYSNIMHRVFN